MKLIWFVAAGSAVGGAARYAVSMAAQQRLGTAFPIGTLVVNVAGALLVGFLMRYALASPAVSADLRAALTTGFCGGLTTFSAFSYEALALVESGDYRRAVLYVMASVGLSLMAVYAGSVGARELLAWRGDARIQG